MSSRVAASLIIRASVRWWSSCNPCMFCMTILQELCGVVMISPYGIFCFFCVFVCLSILLCKNLDGACVVSLV